MCHTSPGRTEVSLRLCETTGCYAVGKIRELLTINDIGSL